MDIRQMEREMKRTRQWWAALTADERAMLVDLEKANNKAGGASAYLPDDCRECTFCGTPGLIGGLCPDCANFLEDLKAKANRAMWETMR
jgi:hypothetical protein